MRRTDKNFLLVGTRRYDLPTFDDCLWLKNLLHGLRVWGGLDQYCPAIAPVQTAHSIEKELEEVARSMGTTL